jgi:hypothetical protein
MRAAGLPGWWLWGGGGGAAPAPPLAAGGACFFNSSAEEKSAVSRPSAAAAEGLVAGVAELRAPLSPGGPGGEKPLLCHGSQALSNV